MKTKTKDRILTATNYTYLEPVNNVRAKKMAKVWGSASNYLNYLIAKDHKDKASIKRSENLKEIFFTPTTARPITERSAEYKKTAAKKRKARKAKGKKKSPAKAGLVKAKPKNSSAHSKKKSVVRSSSPAKRTKARTATRTKARAVRVAKASPAQAVA